MKWPETGIQIPERTIVFLSPFAKGLTNRKVWCAVIWRCEDFNLRNLAVGCIPRRVAHGFRPCAIWLV